MSNGFRILSAGHIQIANGCVEIDVGDYVVAVHKRGSIASISVSVRGEPQVAALRRWAQVTPQTLSQALRFAASLDPVAA